MSTAAPRAVVRARQVSKIFHFGRTQVVALRQVDLDVMEGEFTALVGPSGAGKSTLMNIIACIEEPSTGSLLIGGIDVQRASRKQRAKIRHQDIGMVFQTFNLIGVLSVAENVELPLLLRRDLTRADRRAIVQQAIADVGVERFADFRPDLLSGGQRQRVAIARALVNSPRLVIADEPTANLDTTTAHQIVDLMLHLNESRGVTFLFSTHDEKLIGRVRRTITIRDGQVRP